MYVAKWLREWSIVDSGMFSILLHPAGVRRYSCSNSREREVDCA